MPTEKTAREAELEGQVAKLQQFKDYVHSRLDDAGIPLDPPSPHKAEGCRIGGRLDCVLNGRAGLLVACHKALFSGSGHGDGPMDRETREILIRAIAKATEQTS